MSRRKNKKYYILLIILLLLGVTFGYAVLNSTLNINGKSTVQKNIWDIHFDNIVVKDSSVESIKLPTIENNTTVDFEVLLDKPGDFYEFTVDVVNNGTIDAMIESITKTPDLSTEQQKYLNYIIEYQNGEQISSKQLVEKDSFVRLKVKLEFRKDITASDLPTTSETLSLAFTVNYVQADETGTNVTDNGVEIIKIVSGDLNTVGSEIAIGDEHFYIISSDEDSVTMLAKYNLEVGNVCTAPTSCTLIENPSGLQDFEMLGRTSNNSYPIYGTIAFSSSEYWGSVSEGTYVYDNNSTLYNYVENYKTYLENQGAEVEEARLIKKEELVSLGCSIPDLSGSCESAPSWVYGTSYWTGTAGVFDIWNVSKNAVFALGVVHSSDNTLGVRPVIKVLKS